MKKLVILALVVVAAAALASSEGYEKGKTIIGPLIGLNWYGVNTKVISAKRPNYLPY